MVAYHVIYLEKRYRTGRDEASGTGLDMVLGSSRILGVIRSTDTLCLRAAALGVAKWLAEDQSI